MALRFSASCKNYFGPQKWQNALSPTNPEKKRTSKILTDKVEPFPSLSIETFGELFFTWVQWTRQEKFQLLWTQFIRSQCLLSFKHNWNPVGGTPSTVHSFRETVLRFCLHFYHFNLFNFSLQTVLRVRSVAQPIWRRVEGNQGVYIVNNRKRANVLAHVERLQNFSYWWHQRWPRFTCSFGPSVSAPGGSRQVRICLNRIWPSSKVLSKPFNPCCIVLNA